MEDRFRISVIIPTYNRLNILKECLEGYNSQTLKSENFQVIVIDDGSTDGTYDFLQNNKDNYSFRLKIFRQKNSGANAAREKGIKEAEYPVVLITGDDMIPSKNFLEEHKRYHYKYSDINCAILGFIEWHNDIKLDPFKKYITGSGREQFSFEDIQNGDEVPYQFFYTSNISLKKIFLKSLDYIFDTDFTYPAYDDIELGIRLYKKGLRIFYNKQAIVYHKHNITIDSFGERSFNAGKMAWIYNLKQPSDYTIKSLIINCLKNYKIQSSIDYQKSLLEKVKELKIIINQGINFNEEHKKIIKSFLINKFSLGLYKKINELTDFKKNLNIAVFLEQTQNLKACTYIRGILPSIFLNIVDNVNIFYAEEINAFLLKKIDIVFIQGKALFKSNIFDFLKIMKNNGKKIILDMDEPLWNIKDKCFKFIELIDIITVPTEKLRIEAKNYYNKPCVVIPDYVDINYFYPPIIERKKRKRIYIGIMGDSNNKDDFNFIAPVIKNIAEKYKGKIIIKFWGYIPEKLKEIRGIYNIPFEVDYLKYAERLRKERFDFCIVPMLENKNNNFKSNIKWLELSINQIPAIFSNVYAYENIKNFKTGVKVKNNENEWVKAISLMIEDEKLRNNIKEKAYKEVLQNWTLQKNFHKILNAIS